MVFRQPGYYDRLAVVPSNPIFTYKQNPQHYLFTITLREITLDPD